MTGTLNDILESLKFSKLDQVLDTVVIWRRGNRALNDENASTYIAVVFNIQQNELTIFINYLGNKNRVQIDLSNGMTKQQIIQAIDDIQNRMAEKYIQESNKLLSHVRKIRSL